MKITVLSTENNDKRGFIQYTHLATTYGRIDLAAVGKNSPGIYNSLVRGVGGENCGSQ